MKIWRSFAAFCVCMMLVMQVGAAEEVTGSLTVTLLDQGQPLTDVSLTLYRLKDSATGSAQTLAEDARKNGLPGESRTVDDVGTAFFGDLEPGRYLVVQWEGKAGYENMAPFLVEIPLEIDGKVYYEVTATPKVARIRPEKLPQTGQLRWPVPVLAMLGMGLFGTGFYIRKKR